MYGPNQKNWNENFLNTLFCVCDEFLSFLGNENEESERGSSSSYCIYI